MEKLTNTTLVFLIKKSKGEITNICLAMKKRGFGVNRWNGVGGKMEANDKTIEETAKRETQEEIGVCVKNHNKVAEITFFFPHNLPQLQLQLLILQRLLFLIHQENEECFRIQLDRV